MELTQQLDFPTTQTTLQDTSYGNVVKTLQTGIILMKVKPTGFLLNSNIVADVLNRGDCFVVNLKKGTLYSTKGTTEVEPLEVSATYSKCR